MGDLSRLTTDMLTAARQAAPPTLPDGSATQPKLRPSARTWSFEQFDLSLNPSMADAVKRCYAVAVGQEWCALLIGDMGVGKTHLAYAAAVDWDLGLNDRIDRFWNEYGIEAVDCWGIKRRVLPTAALDTDYISLVGQHSAFRKVPDLLSDLRTGFGDAARWSYEQIVKEMASRSGLTVFDDLGAENQTEWAGEQVYRILDERYEGRLPTIITSNTSLNRLDGRILSRYRSGLVVCRGQDARARGL